MGLPASVMLNGDTHRKVQATWDDIGRMTEVTLPEVDGVSFNTGVTYGTEAIGGTTATATLVTVNDVNGRDAKYLSDARGRLAEVEIGSAASITTFDYDGVGNLVGFTAEPAGAALETLYTYDDFGRMDKVIREDASAGDPTASYTYDEIGRVTCVVNAGNSVVSYEYDGMNRPWKRKYWAGSSCANKGSLLRTIEVGYIGGRIDYVKDDKVGGTALDYEYDEYFRVSSVEQTVCADAACGSTVGETVYYEYDAGDRVTRMATADGETVEYGYYDDGSLQTVSRNGTTVAEYEYDEQGMRSKVTRYRADGVTASSATEYGYDEQGRLTDIHHKDGSTTLSRYQYEYDSGANAKGQRTAQVRTLSGSSVRVEYEYDSFYRLSRAGTWDGSTLEYEYDTLGNILSVTEVDGGFDLEEETYFYDAYGMNRLEAIWYDMDADGNTSEAADYVVRYEYDDAGAMSSRDVINGTTTVEARDYYYDADDMLVEVKEGSTTVVEYVYDALGRRVLKDLGTEETIYFYDGEDVVQSFDGATVVNRYVHGPGVDDLLQGMDSAGGAAFPLTDGLGSLTEFESNGAVFMRSEYSPFGAQTSTYNPYSLQSPYGYTGREYDDETGLMFYRSRYYSPEQRRFTQEDKWPGLLAIVNTYNNKYIYVVNSPINYNDPYGLIVIGFGAEIGASLIIGAEISLHLCIDFTNFKPFLLVQGYGTLGPQVGADLNGGLLLGFGTQEDYSGTGFIVGREMHDGYGYDIDFNIPANSLDYVCEGKTPPFSVEPTAGFGVGGGNYIGYGFSEPVPISFF